MKLYYSPGACSLSPRIILNETEMHYTAEKVNLQDKKTARGDDYLKINPKGQVPALELDNGTLITEGVAILVYLSIAAPAKHLMPKDGSLEYVQALSWLNFIATELHKSFGPLFYPGVPDDYRASMRAKLQKQYAYVDSQLNEKDYLMDKRFSVADAYLYTTLTWAVALKIDLSGLFRLQAYKERMEKRPSVIAALAAEKQ